LLDLSRWGKAM